MRYRKGYKYQLAEDDTHQTDFRPPQEVSCERLRMDKNGMLYVSEGYGWDGASGIIDRKTNLRASMVHDALYELMRKKLLDHKDWRLADKEFARCLKQDGAWKITIKVDMAGLKLMRGKYAHPKHRRKVHEV